MPKPRLTISLPSAQSAQQGTVSVNFDAPTAMSGDATVTLQFLPAGAGGLRRGYRIRFRRTDPAVYISRRGDIQATFVTGRTVAFQPETTAGTLVFSAQAASMSAPQSVSVAAAPVAFGSIEGSRSPASKQIQVTGFDNTRTDGDYLSLL